MIDGTGASQPRTMYEEVFGTPAERRERAKKRLSIVRWFALFDLILLVALSAASFADNRELVSILGPIHGGNFVLLLVLVWTAAADGLWSWWFPAGVLLTGGPIGALIGERLVSRRLARG
jgi:hypothetical protein